MANNRQTYTTNWNYFTLFGRSGRFCEYYRQNPCLKEGAAISRINKIVKGMEILFISLFSPVGPSTQVTIFPSAQ